MSATVSYKGNTLTTVNNQTRVLNTSGKWLEDDITIVDVTQSGGGTPAISVVDTLDAKGGTVRTITALDISDTTATASDVAVGKYFYTSSGIKTAGVNSGGGGTPATQHTIYFEFSDNTDATITAYWNETFVSDAIRATIPTTYGQKTVESASLDGLAWYTKPTETWEVLFNGNNVGYYADETDYPYCWIADLADVEIPVGSVWRITFDGSVYRCVVTIDDASYGGIIGNLKYYGDPDKDDGSGVPFCFYCTPWGAWSGGADVEKESSHAVKIERLVTS